jgi:hypothetical protein
MADIFISYARQDRNAARQLYGLISRAGFTVWVDENLLPGEHWQERIERELNASAAVLVLWSKHSIDSEYVRNEAVFAQKQGKLVPVSIDGTLPRLGHMQRQVVDLAAWDGDASHPGFIRLLSAINEVLKVSRDSTLSARERVLAASSRSEGGPSPPVSRTTRSFPSTTRLILIGILIAWLTAIVGFVVQYTRGELSRPGTQQRQGEGSVS